MRVPPPHPQSRTGLLMPSLALLGLTLLHPAAGWADARTPESEPPLQFAFQWLIIEGAGGAMGITIDDFLLEWDEVGVKDQDPSNSCANLPLRPGEPGLCVGGSMPGTSCVTGTSACPGGGVCTGIVAPCATVTADRLVLLECNTSIRITVQDPTANADPGLIETVVANARSDLEPFGEDVTLVETGADTGAFRGFVTVTSLADVPGNVLVDPSGGGSLVVSYRDPECDLDGPRDEEGGVGQLAEDDFTDVDGDGVLNLGPNGLLDSRLDDAFDDDNCFDVETFTDTANFTQEDTDTSCVDASGATDGTFCVVDADCVAFAAPGFETCRGDRVGDLCDNCPFDFNPGQEDDDDDGIGNVCELGYDPVLGFEDLDGDGHRDELDNCPSTYNPNQADGDHDGIGDVCDGDDDRDGDGVLDGVDNCPDVINPKQDDADADGIGNACEAGEDWDFDLRLNLFDNCPTDFNVTDAAGFQPDRDGDGLGDVCDPDSDDDDNDGIPDDLLQYFVRIECDLGSERSGRLEVVDVLVLDFPSGDGDGIADQGETVELELTLRNDATDTSGAPIALRDTVVVLALDDPSVGCVLDSISFVGDFEPGEERTTPASDPLRITLSRAPGNVTLDPFEVREAAFRLTASTREVQLDTTFTLQMGIDILGDPTGGGPLGGSGELFEDFEGLAGTPGLVDTFDRAGAILSDVIPVIAGTTCAATPLGPADCSVNTVVNDWHLHDFVSEPANAPDSGKAYSGLASLHMGRHLDPSNARNSTYGFRQLSAFSSPKFNLNLSDDQFVEWWQIVRLVDHNVVNPRPPQALDMAIFQARFDESSDPLVDSFGPWRKLTDAAVNPYQAIRETLFGGACKFDPLDDEGENACPSQTGWSDQGSPLGFGVDPCRDADTNGHNDCGAAQTTGPGFTETGNLGTGVWVRTRWDLAEFAGRRAQLRWVISTLAFFGNLQFLSYNETPGSPGAFDVSEYDHGWMIDDIRIGGLVESQLHLVVDGGDDVLVGSSILCGPNLVAETRAEGDDVQVLGLGDPCAAETDLVVGAGSNGVIDSLFEGACPTDPAGFCTTAAARVKGMAGPVMLSTLTRGQPLLLDAATSLLDPCIGGAPEYEFVECVSASLGDPCDPPGGGTLLQAFSGDARLGVSPLATTRYRVRARCSSQAPGTGCLDDVEVRVLVYPSEIGGLIRIQALCETAVSGPADRCDGTDPLRVEFLRPSQGGVDGFDLHRADGAALEAPLVDGATCVISDFGTGLAVNDPISATEPVPFLPALGEAAYYVVTHAVGGVDRPAGRALIGGAMTARFLTTDCP